MVAPPPSAPPPFAPCPTPTPMQTLMHTWHVAIALGLAECRGRGGGGATNVWKVSGNSGSCNIIDLPHWQTSYRSYLSCPAIQPRLPSKFAYFATDFRIPKSNSVSRHKADKLGRQRTLSRCPPSPFLSLCLSLELSMWKPIVWPTHTHTLW